MIVDLVCLKLSASCSFSTVAEAAKLLEIRGQGFEDLEEELEHLEGQKDIVEVAEVYWKETIRDTQTGHSIKQAAEKGIEEESFGHRLSKL